VKISHTNQAQPVPDTRQNYWSWLLREVIFPLGDHAFGQKMMQRLKYLEKAQWWSPEQIERERDQALQQLVRIAYYEVPYYHELMEISGLRPGDIRKPEDLRRLPIATKEILRSNYPGQITRQTGQKTYEARTSGSTGKNFTVLEDAETAGWYRAAFLLTLEWAGWQFGEPHLQTGMTTVRSRDRKIKDFLTQCHYVSAYDLSDSHLDAALDILEKYRIQHLWGYPGSLYLLARRAQRKGWNRPLRTAVTWGDNLYPHYRKTIEDAFATRVTDTYGCAEGIQISAQCEQGNYHIHSLDTIVEFLDDDGQQVQTGQPGSIIVTRLHPGPMPLIRYRIGDFGSGSVEPFCACGRGFIRMGTIQGRDTDMIVTPSGNRLIVHFFTGLLEHFPEIDTFQVVQEEPHAAILRIVPAQSGGNGTNDRQDREQLFRRIVDLLKQKGAGELEIKIELVNKIPLPPSGKRRFVISKIPQE
jgi:phenylacetate-CoA ligase